MLEALLLKNRSLASPASGTWTELIAENGVSPPVRHRHAMTVVGNYLYLFGGLNGSTSKGDFWRFSIVDNLWEELPLQGTYPRARYGHSMVTIGSKIYLYGGYGNDSSGAAAAYLGETLVYDPENNTWYKRTASSMRSEHTAVVIDERMWVFGGYYYSGGDNYYNDTRVYNPNTNTWTGQSGTNLPEKRFGHAAAAAGSRMYIAGGADNASNTSATYNTVSLNSADMLLADVKDWQLLNSTSVFSVRDPSLCTHGEKLYLFGGRRGSARSAAFYEYDPTNDQIVSLETGPAARDQHTAVVKDGKMYVFGGYGLATRNDLWEYTF